jgi:hypothetical protein
MQPDQTQRSQAIQPELLRCLPTQGISYTPQQRWDAALAWSVTGSSEGAARLCQVPADTILYWSTHADWWPLFIREIRERQGQELDAKITGTLDKALNKIAEGLDNDKVTARDAAVTFAILYDKRALHRGQATSRVERVNLSDLKAQFAKVIEAEPSSNTTDHQTPSPLDSTS